MNEEINPYANPSGHYWAEGKYEEWEQWNQQAWKIHLATLPPEEREQAINSKIRFQHRMQTQVSAAPDFETFKKQMIIENPWLLG